MAVVPPNASLFYDGWCPLCRFSVARLRWLDWFHRIRYVDFRTETALTSELPTTPARLAEEMHLWLPTSRTLYHGFGAFRWMAWRLPLLWPIAPFLYFPGVPWLGQKVYLWIARNRFKLVPCRDGVCGIQQTGQTSPEGIPHAGDGTSDDNQAIGSATAGRGQPG